VLFDVYAGTVVSDHGDCRLVGQVEADTIDAAMASAREITYPVTIVPAGMSIETPRQRATAACGVRWSNHRNANAERLLNHQPCIPGTVADNKTDAQRARLARAMKRHGTKRRRVGRLPDDVVRSIRSSRGPYSEIAGAHGVAIDAVKRIKRGVAYKGVA